MSGTKYRTPPQGFRFGWSPSSAGSPVADGRSAGPTPEDPRRCGVGASRPAVRVLPGRSGSAVEPAGVPAVSVAGSATLPPTDLEAGGSFARRHHVTAPEHISVHCGAERLQKWGRGSVAERSSANTQGDSDHGADIGAGAAPACWRLARAGAGRLASGPVMAVYVPSDQSGWNRSGGGWSSRSGTCALCGHGLGQSPAVLEARLPGRTVRVCGGPCRGPHGSSMHILESRSAREINRVADRLDVVYADLSNAVERGDIPFSEVLPILLRIVGEQCVLWRVDEASAGSADG